LYNSVKYVGITINCRLNFQDHIETRASRLSKSVGILCKLKHTLPLKTLVNLYYTMIHPHLLYGITVWGNSSNKYLKGITTLQNKAVKIITGAHWRDHVTSYYAQL